MSWIFDSSSIFLGIVENRLKIFSDGVTLDLAYYEVSNTIWKYTYLLKKIKEEDALTLMEALDELFINMDVLRYEELSGKEVMRISLESDLTIYDGAFIWIARLYGLPIITEDRKLRKVCERRKIEAYSLHEI